MADKDRQRKVEQAAQKIAGSFFTANAPVGQLVTVTRVDASSDLSYLTLFVTLLPEKKPEEDIKKLEGLLPQLRKEIGDRMNLRRVPELRIEFDRRETSRRRVEKILNQA